MATAPLSLTVVTIQVSGLTDRRGPKWRQTPIFDRSGAKRVHPVQ